MAKTLDQLLEEGRFTSIMKRALKSLFTFVKPNLSFVANISLTTDVAEVFVIGKTYVIDELQVGDNFTNIGFVTEGVPFVATGITPTAWTNETEVYNINIVTQLLQNQIDDDLVVSFDWLHNRMMFTSENGIFKLGKVHVQVPSNSDWIRVSDDEVAITNFPLLGKLQSVRIDIYA